MPEGGADEEVRIKLVATDETRAAVTHLKEGLKEVHAETKGVTAETGASAGMMAKFAAGAAVGIGAVMAIKEGAELVLEGVTSAYEMMEKLGEAALEAASAIEKQKRAMGGVLMLMDAGEHGMGAIREYAGEIHEDLESAGRDIGVSGAQMTSMYDAIIARGGIASEAAVELTKNMANVGRVIPGGAEALANGFAMMEMGIVRARNPLVQLIAATGVLHGNAREVAKQMEKMSPDKQIDLAQRAIEKQAEAMKAGGGTPMGLDELKVSFTAFREMALAALGQPMLDAILPPLTSVKDWLSAHAEEIKEFATEVGDRVAEFIGVVTTAAGAVYDQIKADWPQMRATFLPIIEGLRGVWGYIVENKDSIASTIVSAFETAKDITIWIVEAMKTVWNGFEHVLRMMPGTAGIMKAADQTDAERAVGKGAVNAGMGGSEFGDLELAYKRAATEAGASKTEIDAFTQGMEMLRNATIAGKNAIDNAGQMENAQEFADAFNNAKLTGNKSMQDYAVSMLAGNESLAINLIMAGVKIEGGMEDLGKAVEEKGGDLAKRIAHALGVEHINDIAKKGGSTVHMSGGQTFNIKQDFRDQDPDRVAMVFRRDIAKAAVARLSSRLSQPFGL